MKQIEHLCHAMPESGRPCSGNHQNTGGAGNIDELSSASTRGNKMSDATVMNEEVAEIMGISVSTVKNYWAFSRAWLLNEIESE
jgi:hypothetical protein